MLRRWQEATNFPKISLQNKMVRRVTERRLSIVEPLLKKKWGFSSAECPYVPKAVPVTLTFQLRGWGKRGFVSM